MTRKVIDSHKIATENGLECLQLSANRDALKDKLAIVDAAYEKALNEFRISECHSVGPQHIGILTRTL